MNPKNRIIWECEDGFRVDFILGKKYQYIHVYMPWLTFEEQLWNEHNVLDIRLQLLKQSLAKFGFRYGGGNTASNLICYDINGEFTTDLARAIDLLRYFMPCHVWINNYKTGIREEWPGDCLYVDILFHNLVIPEEPQPGWNKITKELLDRTYTGLYLLSKKSPDTFLDVIPIEITIKDLSTLKHEIIYSLPEHAEYYQVFLTMENLGEHFDYILGPIEKLPVEEKQ